MSKLHYFQFGDGEIKIVLVHGWAASGRMWENIHPHFKNVQFFAPEFMGFGKTPAPEKAPIIDEHVDSLIEFVETIQPQVIIGHSMGGLITLKTIHQRPDLAKQLVLICPVVTGNFGINSLLSLVVRNPLGTAAIRASEGIIPALQKEYLLKIAADTLHGESYLARRVKQDFLELNPRAAIEALVSMAQENMQPYLAEIIQPTLICVGEKDVSVPPSEGKTAAQYMPNAELALFDKAKHHPMDEQTADFVPVLKEFLGRFGIE